MHEIRAKYQTKHPGVVLYLALWREGDPGREKFPVQDLKEESQTACGDGFIVIKETCKWEDPSCSWNSLWGEEPKICHWKGNPEPDGHPPSKCGSASYFSSVSPPNSPGVREQDEDKRVKEEHVTRHTKDVFPVDEFQSFHPYSQLFIFNYTKTVLSIGGLITI